MPCRLRALLLLLPTLALSACGDSDHAGRANPARTAATTRHTADGITYRAPAGWHVARRPLTPHLADPNELFTAGTGPLPTGGACAQFPSAALAALRATDVLVTVQEAYGRNGFPPRPASFTLPRGDADSDAQDCAGPRPTFTSSWFGFRQGGRGFYVLVAAGRDAPPARLREATRLLDSLHVTPRRPSRIDPDDALPYDDAASGLHLVHPSAWHVSPGGLTQAVSSGNQVAISTFPLRRQRPSSDCSPRTALRERRRSDGLIIIFEDVGLNQRALARFPHRPARLRLPASSFGDYECFGASREVSFQDGGRVFQAFVSGPPARQRQALAILDSLQARPAPFDEHIHAARFPASARWHTRVSGPAHEGSCLRQRVSWGSTVAFSGGADDLPPHRMIERLPPDGIIIAATQFLDSCRRSRGIKALTPPLRLATATRTGFDGPRGDELPLYRIAGRFAGRYQLDVWVFYGRRSPTPAQRAEAQRELAGVRWPAWL